MYHYYTSERLEKKAEEILAKYKDGVLLLKPQAMDVDHFAEFYCKATIDFANLSEDGLTLGLRYCQIVFATSDSGSHVMLPGC